MIKKVMVVASLSAIVGGGVYYFLVSPNIKENTVLTTKVNPTIESEVQGNIEEKEEQQIDYASISQKLDQYLVGKQFNGTVLVTDKEHVILNKGYGYADVQNKIENTLKQNIVSVLLRKQSLPHLFYSCKNKGN
ncbi:hypothetical protein bcgnr5391_17070 [Bacillus cereus]